MFGTEENGDIKKNEAEEHEDEIRDTNFFCLFVRLGERGGFEFR